MPDLKLSQLTQIQFSDLVSNDLIPVVQVAAGSAGSKVILAGGIIAALSGKQTSSAELSGLATLSTTGFVIRTGTGTYTAAFLSPSDIPSDAVSNVNVAPTAAIAWSKISKVGAVAADVGAVGFSAFSASSPLSYNSGTGGFSIQQASGSQPGFLSASDWTAFNSKQAALGFSPLNPGNNLSDLSNLATARTNLSLVPGADIQVYSARLNDITSLFSSATNGFFLRKNAAGTALEFAAASNGASWGAITGTLSSQTDLNTALGGKQDSSAELTGVTALSTTGVLKRTGAGTYTAGSLIASDIPSSSIDNSKVAISAAIAWSKIDKTGATASDVGAVGLSALSASAPLSYNSGTGAFSIQQANGSQSGFLTSTDWSTFNGKQAALGFTPLNPANNLSDLITPATARTNLGLVIGTDIQAWSARLDDIASNFTAASNLQVVRKNATGTALEFATLSGASASWGTITGTLADQTDLNTALNGKQNSLGFTPLNSSNNLSDLGSTSSARMNLGLVIGTDVQAYSARLQEIVDGFASASNSQVLRKNAGGTALEYATVSGGSSAPVVYRVNDADYTIPSDANIVLSYAQTDTRIFTLPASSGLTSGTRIIVRDAIGASWFGMPIVIKANTGDTINGRSELYLDLPYQQVEVIYDATGSWSLYSPVNIPVDSYYRNDNLANTLSTNYDLYSAISSTSSGSITPWFAGAGGPCVNLTLNTTPASGFAYIAANLGNSNYQITPSSGTWYFEVLMSIDGLMNSTDGRVLCGMNSNVTSTSPGKPVNGVYFMYDRSSSANWITCSANNSTRTETASSVVVATSNYHRLAIKLNGTTSANYSLNRVSLGTVNTNIPSASNKFLPFYVGVLRNGANNGSGSYSFNVYSTRILYVPPSARYT